MEDRHTISEARIVVSVNKNGTHDNNDDDDNNKKLLEWEVDVYRRGVEDPIGKVIINDDTLPPRTNRRGKVVWRLPTEEGRVPSFGTDERRRILELFKENKKNRRKKGRQSSKIEIGCSTSGVSKGGSEDGSQGSAEDEKTKDVPSSFPSLSNIDPADGGDGVSTSKKKKKNKKNKNGKGTVGGAGGGDSGGEISVQDPSPPLPPDSGIDPAETAGSGGGGGKDVVVKKKKKKQTRRSRTDNSGMSAAMAATSLLESPHIPKAKKSVSAGNAGADVDADANGGVSGSPNAGARQPMPSASSGIAATPPPGFQLPMPLDGASSSLPPPPLPFSDPAPPPPAKTRKNTERDGQQQQQNTEQQPQKEPLSHNLSEPGPPPHAATSSAESTSPHTGDDVGGKVDDPKTSPTSSSQTSLSSARYIVIPENERPPPNNSAAVAAAKSFVDLYYPHMTHGLSSDLVLYYTPTAQKSVSVGEAHSVVTGRNDITLQISSLAGAAFVVRGVVAQDTFDGKGVHILVTGLVQTNLLLGSVSSRAFAHSISLVPAVDGVAGEVLPFAFQIHNDALSLLGGDFIPPSTTNVGGG